MSGRTVINNDGSISSAPYFPPFGKSLWASIPDEFVPEFSTFCLQLSAIYWAEIEGANRRKISSAEIPRQIRILDAADSIASALREYIE